MGLEEFFDWMAYDEFRTGEAERRKEEAEAEEASLERSRQRLSEYRQTAGG